MREIYLVSRKGISGNYSPIITFDEEIKAMIYIEEHMGDYIIETIWLDPTY